MKQMAYVVYREDEFFVSQCLNVDVSSLGATRRKRWPTSRRPRTLFRGRTRFCLHSGYRPQRGSGTGEFLRGWDPRRSSACSKRTVLFSFQRKAATPNVLFTPTADRVNVSLR